MRVGVRINRMLYLVVDEAAVYFGIHSQTVRVWMSEGMPHLVVGQPPHNLYLIPATRARAWAMSRKGWTP